jgi:polysaccharide biosynthesis protein PelD
LKSGKVVQSYAPHVAAAARYPLLPPAIALLEITVLFACILGADWLYQGVDLADIRPHPYWLPVLLLSLQYGTVSGLLAAAVAIGLTALGGFPEQSSGETYFAYFIKIWIEPILWVMAAVVLGQFRMRQISRKQVLAGQVALLTNQRAAIADYARNLRSHCDSLERQIAARSNPDVLQVLGALNTARSTGTAAAQSALQEAFSRTLHLTMPGARGTLYALDPTGLHLCAQTAAADGGSLPTWIGPNDALYRAVVGEQRSVSVQTAGGEQALAGHGLAAVPVTLTASGLTPARVVGILKIERADPTVIGSALLPALEVVAAAFAHAVDVPMPDTVTPLHGAPESGASASTGGPAVAPDNGGQRLWRRMPWFKAQPTTAGIPPTAAGGLPRPHKTVMTN